jgi:hypothetical protein
MEDGNERRRRDLEEILELRRSFGTLGRRLVTRQTPVRPSAVPSWAQSAKADPDADARPHEDQQPEPNQEPELEQELDQQAEPYEEPELDQEPDQDQRPEPDQELDQQAEPYEEPGLDWDQEPDQELDLRTELDQEPDRDEEHDQVPTTVRRMTPVVDEPYHVQAPAARVANEPFRIPEPPAARRRLPWPWLVGLAAVFALGMAVDHTVLQPAPRSAPPASTQAVQRPSNPSSSAAPARPPASVPQSCLVTAQRADALIDLLVHKTRGMELTKALKDYTVASQTCRKEASSR